MVMAVVLSGSVFVVVIVPMFRPMIVIMAVPGMVLTVLMFMLVVMGAYAHRCFSGQSASAILTHSVNLQRG